MTAAPDISAILDDLAAGRIDAAEAARRIDAAQTHTAQAAAHRDDPTATDPTAPDPTTSEAPTHEPPAEPDQPADSEPTDDDFPRYSPTDARRAQRGTTKVERVALRVIGRRVRIVSEPAVATVAVDGQHVMRRNGAVMEVSSDGEFSASIDGFQLLRTRKLDDLKALSIGKELFVRVNPRLIVDAEVTGGSLTAENVIKLGRIRITAGSAKLTGVGQLEEAIVQAGQLSLQGAICSGQSRVRAESGTVNIKLDDDSDVTVKAESQLGKIAWSGGHTGAGDEVVMGEGRAKLDVSVVMGFGQIRVGSEDGQQ